MKRVVLFLIKGLAGGSLVGFLVGAYVLMLTHDHVLHRDDFSAPIFFEEAEARYGGAVMLSFMTAFAAAGPFIAAATFGPWMRHAVYGLTASIGMLVAAALLAAAITNQQPFNRYAGSRGTCIDFARIYGLPVALLIGPIAGMLVGRRRTRPAP